MAAASIALANRSSCGLAGPPVMLIEQTSMSASLRGCCVVISIAPAYTPAILLEPIWQQGQHIRPPTKSRNLPLHMPPQLRKRYRPLVSGELGKMSFRYLTKLRRWGELELGMVFALSHIVADGISMFEGTK
jgi:hypothetical protein